MSDERWWSMTRTEFDAWHADQCTAAGLPLLGVRADNGQPAAEGVGVTTGLYSPTVLADDDVRVQAATAPTRVDTRLRRTVEVARPVGAPQFAEDGKLDTAATRSADERAVVERAEKAAQLDV